MRRRVIRELKLEEAISGMQTIPVGAIIVCRPVVGTSNFFDFSYGDGRFCIREDDLNSYTVEETS
jgi:hypothetical protein